MARKPRENVEGGIYHVFARGNDRQAIFRDDRDRSRYMRLLGAIVLQRKWRCFTYCLMDNHVHLLIETPGGDLSPGMQHLHGSYARAFNVRHRRVGHLFQGRYGAVRITSDAQLVTVARYITRNPVEAQLCNQPDEWQWSGFSAVVGGRRPFWLDCTLLRGLTP